MLLRLLSWDNYSDKNIDINGCVVLIYNNISKVIIIKSIVIITLIVLVILHYDRHNKTITGGDHDDNN